MQLCHVSQEQRLLWIHHVIANLICLFEDLEVYKNVLRLNDTL